MSPPRSHQAGAATETQQQERERQQRPTILRASTSTRPDQLIMGNTTRLRSRSLVQPVNAASSGQINNNASGDSRSAAGNNRNASRTFYKGSNHSTGHIPPSLRLATATGLSLPLGGTPLSPIPGTPLSGEVSNGLASSSSSVSEYDTPLQTPEEEAPPFLHLDRSNLKLSFMPTIEASPDAKGKARQQATRQPSFVSIVMPQTPGVNTTEFEEYIRPSNVNSALGRPRQSSLSQAPLVATFPDSENLPGPLGGQATIYNFAKPIVILGVLFASSTIVVVYLISTVPTLHLPKTLGDVVDQANALRHYSHTSYTASLHIFLVLSCMFVWKQAFSIPGSLISNILFGSLYGVFTSTIITSIFTAVGSLLCYLMARKTAPLVRYLMPKPIAFMQANIDRKAEKPADLFSYLLLLRLFPLLPYSALNIAGGVLNVPASPFFWTLVLGSMPFNAVTTQVGEILAALPAKDAGASSLSSIWTPALLFKLFTISMISALPVLFKSRIKSFLGDDSLDQADTSIDLSIYKPTRRTASLEDADEDIDIEISSQSRTSEDETTETPVLPIGLSSLPVGKGYENNFDKWR